MRRKNPHATGTPVRVQANCVYTDERGHCWHPAYRSGSVDYWWCCCGCGGVTREWKGRDADGKNPSPDWSRD